MGKERRKAIKSYSIRPIPLTISSVPLWYVLYRWGRGQTTASCNYVWFIEGASKNILVDAGAHIDAWIRRRSPCRRSVQTPEQGLAKLGLKPEDIDLVLMTHLHWDHLTLAHKYAKAKFLVQKPELDFARNPHPIEPIAYDPQLVNGINFEVIEGDYEVEEGITLMVTPGHTPGGQSVVVNTSEGKAIIDSMCAIDENYNPELITETVSVITPTTHVDPMQAYESLLKIKQVADIIIPLHEIRFAFIDRIPSF